jgi:hydroxybutyrate-dimer hydrolase
VTWRIVAALALTLCACAHRSATEAMIDDDFASWRVTEHRGSDDDLLSAGLGLAGLRNPAPPAIANPAWPTSVELRRRALHTNWRGIADLASVNDVPRVAGREYSTFARLPNIAPPQRVLVQVPERFDRKARCLIVAPASGSRGVYGAVAFAGAFGLPRGCAVVYTDKGAGTGFFDVDTDTGVALDGTRDQRGSQALEFEPPRGVGAAHGVLIKHAHGQHNSEALWGRYTLQAARFGLAVLNDAFPDDAPFTADNTLIVGAALSNGGGALLRASEIDEQGLFDAVVALAPNITAPGARPLYDYASEAALLQPCAALALDIAPRMNPAWQAQALLRCASLRGEGLIDGADAAAMARDALARLRASGWEDRALRLAGLHVDLDLWRALVATYAPAYARAAPDEDICGYRFAMVDAAREARANTDLERALWWSDGSGIAPTAGVMALDMPNALPDATWLGVHCARTLWTGSSELAQRLRAGVAEAQANARPRAPLTVIVHGADDGLVPVAFTSRPYVAAARAHGARIELLEVPDAQHFDAFVALPALAERYRPLLPHGFDALQRALDAALARR